MSSVELCQLFFGAVLPLGLLLTMPMWIRATWLTKIDKRHPVPTGIILGLVVGITAYGGMFIIVKIAWNYGALGIICVYGGLAAMMLMAAMYPVIGLIMDRKKHKERDSY